MTDTKFNKFLLFINGLVPLGLLSWDGYFGQLGANPVEFFLRTTGILTLSFLVLTLLISPMRKILGLNGLIRFRRMLGLYAFFYGLVHLVTYSIFDKSLDITAIAGDVWQRPFIAFGMIALTLMIPLAVTSTNGMIKRLGGKRWQKLHQLIYPIVILGVVHFYLIQKSDFTYPIIFGLIVFLLLGFRFFERLQKAGNKRSVT
ncbi:MAG: sulfoxide reductase heme-binding subunit YedZ [Pyrinomonadaceae bacterium]|nr:sulfoxide reductase heme-binding subunit YedZ [Pyrinomonadaceae bacterium]